MVFSHECFNFWDRFFNGATPPQNLNHQNSFIPHFFITWSTIPIGCTSKDKSSLSSIGGASKTCDGSRTYFFNINTWKILCIRLNSNGSSKQYAIGSILSIILNRPIYLGLSFSLFLKLNHSFPKSYFEKHQIAFLKTRIYSVFNFSKKNYIFGRFKIIFWFLAKTT